MRVKLWYVRVRAHRITQWDDMYGTQYDVRGVYNFLVLLGVVLYR